MVCLVVFPSPSPSPSSSFHSAPPSPVMGDKPRVLVLGGVGFIGRNLVKYLVNMDACSKIRVVDKALPATSYFSAEMEEIFRSPIVEFMQGNLSRDATVTRAFQDEGGKWTYVFNLAAETRYGQEEAVYKEKVFDVSVKCGYEAAKMGVKKFVELSTAQVYDPHVKRPNKEDAKLKPWTLVAKCKLRAEEELKSIEGLNLVILRPAVVYGPADVLGLSPRIISAAVYKKLGEKMKFLWTGDLRINTVHVNDVCTAIWHVAHLEDKGLVFNLADKADTTQEKFNMVLEKIFGIRTGFAGSLISNMARLNMEGVTEDTNEKHMKPWSELCAAAGISSSPLTPYLDQELLYHTHLWIDGTAIESTGFHYTFPEPSEALIREQIKYYTDLHLFPDMGI